MTKKIEEYKLFCYFHHIVFYNCETIDDLVKTFELRDIDSFEDRTLLTLLLTYGYDKGYELYKNTIENKDRLLIYNSSLYKALKLIKTKELEHIKNNNIKEYNSYFSSWYKETGISMSDGWIIPFIKEKPKNLDDDYVSNIP